MADAENDSAAGPTADASGVNSGDGSAKANSPQAADAFSSKNASKEGARKSHYRYLKQKKETLKDS